MYTPEWWSKAEPQIHDVLCKFTTKIRTKLETDPATIIGRKNPFLFRARTEGGTKDYAESLIYAFLSSSEETMFGNALEDIAIAVCSAAKGGRKSGIANIDIEYDVGNTRTIIQVKSGPNWGNSSQRAKLKTSFQAATRIIRQGIQELNVRQIEGICYGRSKTNDLGSHQQMIGDHFWREISDWDGTAKAVLSVIGEHASNGLHDTKSDAVERMVAYLHEHDVAVDGAILWDCLHDLISK